MNPLNMAMNVLKQHPSYDKKNLSDAAIRHKREYDTKYESTPERTKYRTDLKRERRNRNMMGHGGPDLSHTKQGGLVRENVHDNRARNQPGQSLKMLKFLPEQDPSGAFPPGSPEERGWWTTLQQAIAPDSGEETEVPQQHESMGVRQEFPGTMVGDKWASTREEAEEMGSKFPPQDRIIRPEVAVMSRPKSLESGTQDYHGQSDDTPNIETEASKAGGYEGVKYGEYPSRGRGYHEGKDLWYDGVEGLHNLQGDDLLTHVGEFDKDGYAYMDKIGVAPHHQKGFGQRLHAHFKNQLGELKRRSMEREYFTQQGMNIEGMTDEDMKDMADEERDLRNNEEWQDHFAPLYHREK